MYREGSGRGKVELGVYNANLEELQDLTGDNGGCIDPATLMDSSMMDFVEGNGMAGNTDPYLSMQGGFLPVDYNHLTQGGAVGGTEENSASPTASQNWMFSSPKSTVSALQQNRPTPLSTHGPILPDDLPSTVDQAMMALLEPTSAGTTVVQPQHGHPQQNVQSQPQMHPVQVPNIPMPISTLDSNFNVQTSAPFAPPFQPAPSVLSNQNPEPGFAATGTESMERDTGNGDKVINEILARISRMNVPTEMIPDRGADRDTNGSFFLEEDGPSRVGRPRESAWNSDGELRERSNSMRNNVRRVSPGPASRFCHICARTQKTARHITCANFKKGECRKSVCEKCFTS